MARREHGSFSDGPAIRPSRQRCSRPIIAEQARLVSDDGLVAARRRKSQLNRVFHVLGPHACAVLPCDDVAAVIIQDRAEIKPAPADDLEVGEVGLPLARQMLSKCRCSQDHREEHEDARQVARDIARTRQYDISMKLRKKVEMLFAHLKRILGLGRLRLRGPCGANDEFLLAATAQNLRKLAKIFPAPQQPHKA